MATNVPSPTFGPTGFVPPTEQAILLGVQADLNEAFNTTFNFGTTSNPTPQGQLAASLAATIGNANNLFCALANSVDPAYATGRIQDGIGRIYFLERIPDRPTIVNCLCVGQVGTFINPGALAQDAANNIYSCVSGGFIPASGSVLLQFANNITGPIPCPANTLTVIYRSIPGWDTITNPEDGVLGNEAESPSAFEQRREQSVQSNTVGYLPSILGEVLGTAGVLDAYVTDNPNAYPVASTPEAVITASISGTTLTVISIASGAIKVGQNVTGSSGTSIGVEAGTTIVSGSGLSWQVSASQTVSATTMNLGGVILGPNDLYVAAVGGDPLAVATAIWNKKAPGCPYYPGNTTEIVYDSNAQYAPPGVPYTVVYEVPDALPFAFQVNIANGPGVPSNAATLIQTAIIAAFAGADGGQRAKIGSTVFASRFYPGINALGAWAEIVSLFLGSTNTPTANVTATVGATFTATGTGTSLVVTGINTGGHISAGDVITGPGVPSGTTIVSGPGGNGTYITSVATTAASSSCTTASNILNVTAVASGALAVNTFMFDSAGHITEGSMISALGTGAGGTGTYVLTGGKQTVASESMEAVLPALTRVAVQIDQVPTIIPACIEVNLV